MLCPRRLGIIWFYYVRIIVNFFQGRLFVEFASDLIDSKVVCHSIKGLNVGKIPNLHVTTLTVLIKLKERKIWNNIKGFDTVPRILLKWSFKLNIEVSTCQVVNKNISNFLRQFNFRLFNKSIDCFSRSRILLKLRKHYFFYFSVNYM